MKATRSSLALGPGATHLARAGAIACLCASLAAFPARAAGVPVHYDPARHALVLVYRGKLPAWASTALADPPRVALDFSTDFGLAHPAGATVAGDPLLLSWALAPRPGHHARLTLTFRGPAGVAMQDDPAGHRLLLIPLAPVGASLPPVRPTPAPSVKLPTPAPSPSATPRPVPPPSFLPIVPGPSGSAPSPAPSFEPGAEPLPTPANPFPSPSGAASPAPAAPGASPSMQPFPPPEEAPTEPAIYSLGASLDSYQELYGPGRVATNLSWVPTVGAAWEGHWPAPFVERARLDFSWYTFPDLQVQGATHLRDSFRGEVAFLYRLQLGGLSIALGPGYLGRYETASHSQAPPAPTYAFAASRLIHGPTLEGFIDWQVGGGFGFYLEGMGAPWMFSSIDGNLPAMPMLWGESAELGLEQQVGPVIARFGYRSRVLSGTGYDESFMGPVLTVGVQPSWP